MKRRGTIAAICTALLLAIATNGCGSAGAPAATTAAGTAAASAAGTTAAASKDAATTAETAPAVDISEKVSLNIFTFGASNPADMDMINEAASKITSEKINADVTVTVMADWMTRYKLALSSGEPIDMIWTAMWFSYQPYAFDGAWLDITDMVDNVAPELRTLIGQDIWDMCKIGGKDYAIPCVNRTYSQWGVAWREDLRKKYNCPEIKDWETMEQYAEAIKANEPGMIPFCDSPNGGLWHSFSEKNHLYAGLGNPQFSYGLGVKTDNPRDLLVYHETDAFKDYCETQRRWVENGYIQPDAASSTDTGNAGMLSGKYAGSINGQGIVTTLNGLMLPAKQSNPDWEIGYMNFGEMFKWSYRSHPTFMAFALPNSSPNPERALLFAKELMTNKELFNLYDCGIEGTHYKVENGYYVSLNDPVNPGYLQGAAGITNFLFNKDAKIYSEAYNWVLDYEKKMDQYEVDNYFEGFPEDYASYSAQVTAMSEVNTQYTWPLLRGTMDDVAGAIADVNKRLDAAGRQEVVANVIKQYNAYLDGMGVK